MDCTFEARTKDLISKVNNGTNDSRFKVGRLEERLSCKN